MIYFRKSNNMPFENKEKSNEYHRNRIAKTRSDFLSGKSCVKCGSEKELEIDHIKREDKISHRIWSWSKERREKELKKCQILCVLCHREKTVSEMSIKHCYNWYKTKKCRCEVCAQSYRLYRDRQNQKKREKNKYQRVAQR